MTADDEYRNFHLAWIMCFQSNLGLGKRALEFEGSCFARSCRPESIQVIFTITVIINPE